MVQTAQALLAEFQGLYTYTESDESSLLLPRNWARFDRELEKAVSLAAGLASATFAQACGARPTSTAGPSWTPRTASAPWATTGLGSTWASAPYAS